MQITDIRAVSPTKISFVLMIANGSKTPVSATDFIGVTSGSDIDSDGFPIVHVLGQKPEWHGEIRPGHSQGEVFDVSARRSALTDATVAFEGVSRSGNSEGEPVVFRGDLSPAR